MRTRHKIAVLLEKNDYDTLSHWVDIGLISLIMLNVIAIVLESVNTLASQYQALFLYFELFSVTIFTIEYIARVWCAIELPQFAVLGSVKGRLRYMSTTYALIDLAAILPFYLGLFITSADWRFLRVIRLLRLFKLSRYSTAMQALLRSLKAESDSLAAAFFLLFVLFVLASSGIYLLEHQIQPEAFGNIPSAMWWAMATLTTVGYGDVVPITTWGKIFGGCITIIGVGMVALPAGIIASGFSEHLQARQTNYDAVFKQLLDQQQSLSTRLLAASKLGQELRLETETLNELLRLSDINSPFGHERPDASKPPPDAHR